MLSSGGKLLLIGVAPMVLSLVEGPGSIMEGRMSGSAKSEEKQKGSRTNPKVRFLTNVVEGLKYLPHVKIHHRG